jgi:hypothetical protein
MIIMGRKLFWLFVGTAGFLVGIGLASRFIADQPEWVMLSLALMAGVVGVLLAIFIQKIAIGLAGFLAGGYGLVWLISNLQLVEARWLWIAFIFGGLAGALFIATLFDVALIVLSSFIGSSLIVQALEPRPAIALAMFVIILLGGIMVQSRTWTNRKSSLGA